MRPKTQPPARQSFTATTARAIAAKARQFAANILLKHKRLEAARMKKGGIISQALPRPPENLREILLANLECLLASRARCPYCDVRLLLSNVSVDHRVPLSRGGTSHPDNLTLIDRRCNKLKGELTGEEYRALREWLDDLEEEARLNIERRLLMGGSVFRFQRTG